MLTEANGKLIAVELHEGAPDLPGRSWAEIVRRSRLMRLGATQVRALGAEDELRQLCGHFLRHSALRPLWLCDIAAAIEQLPADFDWDYFGSGDRWTAAWTRCFLGLACHLLGARTAAPHIADAAATVPRWLVANVLWRWGTGVRRPRLLDLLRRPIQLRGVVQHQWLNRITIAYRSRLAPNCSPAKVLAFAALQQPIKAGIRLRRIVAKRFGKWTATPAAPFNLHPSDISRYC